MTPPTVAAATIALGLSIALQAAGAVYRCTAVDGVPRYSQFPCGNEAELVLESLQIVKVPPLSAAEQAVLDELQRERSKRRTARDEVRRRAAREADRERAARASRCRSARTALDALARQRRKGYTLQQARELDRREAELEATVRDDC